MIDVEKTLAVAAAEMERLNDAKINVLITLPRAVSILSTMQLALRHPEIPPEVRALARIFCDQLIDLIGRASPILGDFVKLGDNPQADVPK